MRGVHVDVYREIEHGERTAWSGLTGPHCIAKVPELLPGNYRVVADSGKLDTTMLLSVSGNDSGMACEMKLMPPDAPKTVDSLPEQTASIRLREFRGVVQDNSGAVIQRAKIRVLETSDREELAKIQSDERGQFCVYLDRGTYLAVFQVPGFKTQVVGVKVVKDGWDAVRLTMEIDGKAMNVPPEKWQPPN